MFCQCGCGGLAPIAKMTNRLYGWIAGQPVRFIAGHNQRARKRASGYRMVVCREHPRAAHATGCVQEHVLIAERALGRYMPDGVEVHHVDENKLNNTNRNLVICQDREYHNLLHVRARVLRAGGNPNTDRLCSSCKRPLAFSEFHPARRNRNGGVSTRCKECARSYERAYVRRTG